MIEHNISLKPYNTFGIDVEVSAFARFNSVSDLEVLLSKNNSGLPYFILGGGSNVLLTKDQEVFALKNEIEGKHVVQEDEESVIIEVGAGEVWHDLVMWTVENNWGGLENLSLIPGSVGASPMQNIGAYGVEIKDRFVSLQAYHIDKKEVHVFDNAACEFGYRESVFKRKLKGQYIILTVRFRLYKSPVFSTGYGAIQDELRSMGVDVSVKTISQAVMNIRRSKLPDPKELGNAGSFFKNPVVSEQLVVELLKTYPQMPHYPQGNGTEKLAAGWLIEKAGLKGYRSGACGVHSKQALVLVNYGEASGNDVFALSEKVLTDVKRLFNVDLEREVNIM